MFSLSFSIENVSDKISGFELGHIDILTEKGSISSRDRKPDQAMMIFVTMIDLLDGLRELFQKKTKWFQLVGADSSFKINFVRLKEEQIGVYVDRVLIKQIDEKELSLIVLDSCRSFYDKYRTRLCINDAIKEDLEVALQEYQMNTKVVI
jgi:hypothetical protein